MGDFFPSAVVLFLTLCEIHSGITDCIPGDPNLSFRDPSPSFKPICEIRDSEILHLGRYEDDYVSFANMTVSCYNESGSKVIERRNSGINSLSTRNLWRSYARNFEYNFGLRCYFTGCHEISGHAYRLNNSTCYIDFDECSSEATNDCDENARCVNDMEGTYTCTCNSGYMGNGTKCEAIPPVVLEKISADQVVQNGSVVDLNCTGSSSQGKVSITWSTSIPGLSLPQPTEITLDENTLSSSITLDSVDSSYNGDYICNVSNTLGSVLESTSLSVISIVGFEVPVMLSGSTEILRCVATGHPSSLITWHHNDTAIASDSNFIANRASQEVESVVYLSKITEEHAGTYTCIVTIPDLITITQSEFVSVLSPAEAQSELAFSSTNEQAANRTQPELVFNFTSELNYSKISSNKYIGWSIVITIVTAVGGVVILCLAFVMTKIWSIVKKKLGDKRLQRALRGDFLDDSHINTTMGMDAFTLQAELNIKSDEHSIHQALNTDPDSHNLFVPQCCNNNRSENCNKAACNRNGFVSQNCCNNSSESYESKEVLTEIAHTKDALLTRYSTSSECSGYASIERDDLVSQENGSSLSSINASEIWPDEFLSIKSDLKRVLSACSNVAQRAISTEKFTVSSSPASDPQHISTLTSFCSARPITSHKNMPQKVLPEKLVTTEDRLEEDQAYRQAPNVDISQLLEDAGHYERIQTYERVPDVDITQLLALMAAHVDTQGYKKVPAVDIQQFLASLQASADSPDSHQCEEVPGVGEHSKPAILCLP